MVTIKSYTDIEQSKKLAKILPIESADMCLTFVNKVWNSVWGKAGDICQLQKNCYEPDYTKDDYVDFDEFEPKVVPCWSLVALLSVLPRIDRLKPFIDLGPKLDSNEVAIYYHSEDSPYIVRDNLIDACYEMILKLHELNLL